MTVLEKVAAVYPLQDDGSGQLEIPCRHGSITACGEELEAWVWNPRVQGRLARLGLAIAGHRQGHPLYRFKPAVLASVARAIRAFRGRRRYPGTAARMAKAESASLAQHTRQTWKRRRMAQDATLGVGAPQAFRALERPS